MPNSATLQTSIHENLYQSIEEWVKETKPSVYGILFLYASAGPTNLDAQVRRILESQPNLDFEVWSDGEANRQVVLLPELTLDSVHFQGLLLKQRLLEVLPNLDLRITLASFPEQGEASQAVLKQMSDSVMKSEASDIHIFTKEEAEAAKNRILIVDNDATIREFLQIRFELQGYETYEADNGLVALDLIEKLKPDLVLTELNLYGIDGLPYIHHIQQIHNNQAPKIVVLTEQKVEQTISQCFERGVDDYITKPFSPVELDARIRRCIQ
ncbi:CheY-like chemotaxis protein [Paenibacillus shirakamiensis]|uniref:CheY-like chemotaxis protein n=1 Tax=Paenibacillus shirakamiensis TaxID=1265935 RepID=A0ABS4JCI0_9BACL|nr:response regulator [Paenibacillus shirakamiensis]MBP1999380.1 CheY-like chemotaxis protein [Paenibacillus shirakamiensis]